MKKKARKIGIKKAERVVQKAVNQKVKGQPIPVPENNPNITAG
jgi:hypothetical protein